MNNTPETTTNHTDANSFLIDKAMTPVHIPKLTPDDERLFPPDIIEACEILVKDVLQNQTAG